MSHDFLIPNEDFFSENPEFEKGLWKEWVISVCNSDKITQPSDKEWVILSNKWYSGKAPIDSVYELRALRSKS